MVADVLVSVIIPAYNTQEYIGEMLDCVIRQTYQNIQIIVIDDGSTDGTAEIVKEKQKTDKRIELVLAKRGGVSQARNIGIQKSKGVKILFWDSDDIVELDAIERLIEYSISQGVNSVLYGYSNYIDGKKGNPFKHSLLNKYEEENIVNQLCPFFLGHSFADINTWIKTGKNIRMNKENNALWRILLDAAIVKDNNLLFDNTLSLGEDTKFINMYFLYETSIGFLNECFYYLRIRSNSLNASNKSTPVLMADNKMKLIEARKEVDYVASKKGYNTHRFWEGTLVLSALELALRLSKDEHPQKENKEMFLEYMRNPDVKKAIKMFKPEYGIRAIPFALLKYLPAKTLFYCARLTPKRIQKKIS